MSAWRPDELLPGFEALELPAPADYDGAVVATLVRLPGSQAPRGAVLYVHGFSDYFFQRHMAERFSLEGFAFYALDLRKYGRSLKAHQHPNFCKSVAEYYADIDAAIEAIGAPVLLAGHSTGGLVCSLYAKEGARRGDLRGLWLNSPFFDWRAPAARLPWLHVAATVGRLFPFLTVPERLPPTYVNLLLEQWEFDTRLKPLRGFPLYYGWIGAVSDAHAKVHRGLGLEIPVLSMHSDESDIVLDWRQIARWSRTLGGRVAVLAFPGGWHDLVLSPRPVREEVFSQLFSWAERAEMPPA
jgi:alpha-beta hydrolase superfamily lysophospholipase